MDKRKIRRSATKKFMENFDQQFSESLQETQNEKSSSKPDPTYIGEEESKSDEQFYLSDLEEAMADIDEYMKTNKKEPPSSTQY
ncbi:MAG: hypothetical protein WBA93_25580 [Microcoleaceae cyanobacterium]